MPDKANNLEHNNNKAKETNSVKSWSPKHSRNKYLYLERLHPAYIWWKNIHTKKRIYKKESTVCMETLINTTFVITRISFEWGIWIPGLVQKHFPVNAYVLVQTWRIWQPVVFLCELKNLPVPPVLCYHNQLSSLSRHPVGLQHGQCMLKKKKRKHSAIFLTARISYP